MTKKRPNSLESHGKPLDARLKDMFGVSWGQARAWIETGKVRVDGHLVTQPTFRIGENTVITRSMNAPRPPKTGQLEDDSIVALDPHIVVVNKPAGVSTVAYDEQDRDPLDGRVKDALARRSRGKNGAGRLSLGVVHRLDKETSGLLVFTRTWLAKEALSRQMRDHTVHRRYLAIVHGSMSPRTLISHLVVDRGDGLRGSLEAQRLRGYDRRGEEGRHAVTHVEVVARCSGATLIACRLETGRTHQIRIHLSEAGHPIVGERVYIRGFDSPLIEAPRLMLHAAELGFAHPASNQFVQWERPPPNDFQTVAKRLAL